jgi:hypothetical protein
MISFSRGRSPSEEGVSISPKQLEALVKAIAGSDPYYAGSYHAGLPPDAITEIIKHLMFVDKNESVQIIIDKEVDGYHLALTIDKKE